MVYHDLAIFQVTKGNELTSYRSLSYFLFGYFLFHPIKNNAVLEPRTGHFQRLVGFETKIVRFEAKANAMDIKMCP